MTMYVSMQRAIPETTADMMKMTGMSGEDHQGFDLSETNRNQK